MTAHVKRAYDPAEPGDGVRVLVDRLWPRGVSKADAHIDEWLTEIAPTNELRKKWHSVDGWHEGNGFDDFQAAYREELEGVDASEDTRRALQQLQELSAAPEALTLVTASKNPAISHVAVILEVLRLTP